ncbi:hypothetical protein [Bernardetia sp.]|uniref:hypothetical protein n=1 Tax=Bernardetia sp. TaxID=1937974 RepID=UPI0025BC91E3|nr:hypothetical protein [Bernardetia sp.]
MKISQDTKRFPNLNHPKAPTISDNTTTYAQVGIPPLSELGLSTSVSFCPDFSEVQPSARAFIATYSTLYLGQVLQ